MPNLITSPTEFTNRELAARLRQSFWTDRGFLEAFAEALARILEQMPNRKGGR